MSYSLRGFGADQVVQIGWPAARRHGAGRGETARRRGRIGQQRRPAGAGVPGTLRRRVAEVDRAADRGVHRGAAQLFVLDTSWPMAAFTSAGPARYRPLPSVISSLSHSTGR